MNFEHKAPKKQKKNYNYLVNNEETKQNHMALQKKNNNNKPITHQENNTYLHHYVNLPIKDLHHSKKTFRTTMYNIFQTREISY